MRKKRFKSILAVILAASMIMGSNNAAFATEAGGDRTETVQTVSEGQKEEEAGTGAAEPAEVSSDEASGKTVSPDATEAGAADEGKTEEGSGSEEKKAVSEDVTVSDNKESVSTDSGVSENEGVIPKAETEEEEAAGADALVISLSADTVSYDGERKSLTLSANKDTGYVYKYKITNAGDETDLNNLDYGTVSYNVDRSMRSIKDGGEKFKFTVSAVNAGRYAVSVNAYKDGSAVVSANAAVFLSINKAGKVFVSADSIKKYYDGEKISSNSFKPRWVSGNKLYVNAETGKDDTDLIKYKSVSFSDVGRQEVVLDTLDKKLTENYESISSSKVYLEIVSVDVVIRSKDYKKIYDGKRVEEKDREGISVSANDGTNFEALKKTLNLQTTDFNWDKTSLISGNEGVLVSANKFELTDAAKAKFYEDGKLKKNFASVKLISGNIVIKKFDPEIPINNLTAPVITSVKMNNKGWVTVKWKKAKTYKGTEGNRYKNTARYMIYRFDEAEQEWVKLNTSSETVRTYGQTGTSFVDKQGGKTGTATYIYKVNVAGYDSDRNYGMAKEASYMACQPIALEVATRQKQLNTIDFEISNIRGADEYVIERSGKKNFKEIQKTVTVSATQIGRRLYYGSKLVSANSYKDDGKLVKSGVKNPAESVFYTDKETSTGISYYYRAKVLAQVTDYDTGGMPYTRSVESAMSSPLNGKCTVYPPDMMWTYTSSYNKAIIAFEKLSDDIINTKDGAGSKKDKYQILCSTKADSGYKVVKTFTARQLEHPDNIDNLFMIPAGKEISVNGVYMTYDDGRRISVSCDCYAYYFSNLKPEVTYYYKVRAVKEGIAGPAGIPMTVTPRMDDATSIAWAGSNYNYITVSVGHVIGSKQMVIYYWAVKDERDKAIPSDNKLGYNHKKKKTFTVNYNKKKKTYTEKFKIPGLKYGYTYEFYAQPKNGKEHVSIPPITAQGMTLPAVPVLKVSAKSLTEINVSWNAVPGATGYEVIVEDTESNAVTRTYFKKAGKHVWKGGTGGWDGKELTPGKPYNFRIRSFKKSSTILSGNIPNYNNGNGLWSNYSNPSTEWGRPSAPSSPKSAWSGYAGTGAKLTWKHSKDKKSYPKNIFYAIEKRVYTYNSKNNTVATKYVSYNIVSTNAGLVGSSLYSDTCSYHDSSAVNRGDKIVYRISSVYKSDNTKYGNAGYVLGKGVNVMYATPYSIAASGSTEIKVGDSVKWNVTYTPSYTTMKKLSWKSDNTGVATVKDGTIKGVAEGTATITARSVHDPDKVYFSRKITVKKAPSAAKGDLKVCIDAGHGGNDSGATNNGLLEKTCNLEMAQAMKSRLEDYGVPVVMTRSGDSYLAVGDRPKVAANNGCNLFISIHCNSGGGTGTEVWKSITSYHDDGLANKIMGYTAGAFGIGQRGVKTRTGDNGDYYGVIRGSAAAGINGMIVETAFIDGDFDKLNNSTLKQNAGKAIADAILDYYGYK